jgi:hypothetical protein
MTLGVRLSPGSTTDAAEPASLSSGQHSQFVYARGNNAPSLRHGNQPKT